MARQVADQLGGKVGAIVLADNLEFLEKQRDQSVDIIYIDPPFNTGKRRKLTRHQVVSDPEASRYGFGGKTYRVEKGASFSYPDQHDDYIEGFLYPRLAEAHRILSPNGSFFLHIDNTESHYAKIALDQIFGRASFINEIIWAYDYGGRSRRKWPAKHDTIFWYAKNPKDYTFNYEEIDRIPYMAPKLVSPEKVHKGKTPTDVWWHTIVNTSGQERTGYPSQKPLGVLNRIIKVHSRPDDLVLDFFCGSGTTGVAAAELGRRFLLVDNQRSAVTLAAKRLAKFRPRCIGFRAPKAETAKHTGDNATKKGSRPSRTGSSSQTKSTTKTRARRARSLAPT